MIRRRIPLVVVAAATLVAMAAPAEARVRHHHHRHVLSRVVPPLALSASPIPPRFDGYAAGVFESGIPGASSADPYEYQPRLRRGYGYIAPGYDGPGFGSPGY